LPAFLRRHRRFREIEGNGRGHHWSRERNRQVDSAEAGVGGGLCRADRPALPEDDAGGISEFNDKGYDATAIALDITDHAAVDAAAERIIREKGKIDILVNNAGIIARGSIKDLDHETWRKVMDVNVNGTFNWCKAVAPGMMERRIGKIVNISSIAGKMGDITAAPSTARPRAR
jgi:NAD(P)-dependent dehydrogenase (short-subunit alcohol dehydrogenase family)